ncbi:tetratricopeptide repeat protein [Saccharopolyspora indica]|uniref:helix-turn-helix domain-containing protein n=1 Tax=Saccharopolyspora indica TaxID=1229659 RepID=UPI0022EB9E29|nr:helix-turn-helix domain-containing protein [Saccharopolyspora indica]MDA3648679.1 tetratricopeptide repeat protein [Saccharopolyspora indica]
MNGVRPTAFGIALRKYRESAHIGLRAFARQIMFSPGHLSHVETGAKRPTVEFARACENALGLDGVLLPLVSNSRRAPIARPTQLPARSAYFVGRKNQLEEISKILLSNSGIAIVEGPPGVGKTALAVQCASSPAIKNHYQDGILYTDLHGFTSSRAPVDVTDILEHFLRALGVSGEQIPSEVDARAALFRSVLEGQRVLLVLDNAADVAQVRPLLPGASSCAVLITSRRQLVGLSIRNGAKRLCLGPLDHDEAAQLLCRIIGDRAKNDPKATAQLADLCSCWPLALQVAGERAVTQDHLDVPTLCRELRNARLDSLSANEEDDATVAVRAVFGLSYDALNSAEARTFRFLGLHQGCNIGTTAVAALTDCAADDVSSQLRRLCGSHLVGEISADRYRLHDLLRLYAAERTSVEDERDVREKAVTRLLDYYLGSIDTATSILGPYRMRPDAELVDDRTPAERFDTYLEALDWCDQEVVNFASVLRNAVDHGYPGVWRFAASLWDFFHVRQPWGCWWATNSIALRSLREHPDPFGKAWILTSIGDYHRRRNDLVAARDCFEQAFAIRRDIDDVPGQGWIQLNLGITANGEGNSADALSHLRKGMDIFAELKHQYGQGRCLLQTAYVLIGAEDHESARGFLHQALDLFEQVDDRHDQALVWVALGRIDEDKDRAVGNFETALPILRDIGDWEGEVDALTACGDLHFSLGRAELAERCWRTALVTLRGRGETFSADALLDHIKRARRS